jgi:hypothetical protein
VADAIYTYTNSTGVITTADAATIQNVVVTEYQTVFGTDLVAPDVDNLQGSSTPQGILINAEAQSRIALADNNAAIANQINPNVSGGIFLDALLALTGAARNPATQTTVYASLTGTANTVIPAGSLASETASGNAYQYYLVSATTLDSDGNATDVQFNSVLYGAIPCNENTLTTIISNIIGWDSVGDNTAPDPIGQVVQSDASARNDRLVELGIQGNSLAGAIIGAVNLVLGTLGSIRFLENFFSTSQTIDGVLMVAHSIYISVFTPNSTYTGDIAQFSRLSLLGTNSTATVTFTGTNTTVIPAGFLVYETTSGYNNQFYTNTSATIPSGLTIDVPVTAVSTGVVSAPIGSITCIVTPLSGVSSVTNAAAATNGTQSLIAYQIVSKKSAGAAYNNASAFTQVGTLNSTTTISGLTTSVMSVGMSVSGLNIPTGAVILSITNSTTIVISIAATATGSYLLKFGLGVPQQAMVIVPYSNQQMIVLFDTANPIRILVSLTVTVVTPLSDPTTAIRGAITTYADGGITGIPGLVVGQAVSAFELAGAVTSQFPGVFVHSCLISISPTSPTSSVEIPISIYQIATIAATTDSDISVTFV